ncbi:universal stress protein [Alsobacter soli]|uniref:Universal stress protein n=1 Tax=Alsobacter soli TaxID=2109933 RepID=A0A2T1HVB2_9HYPH|nr:universal stress protein [Alsobacter soli]PSC05613.1 universal stress protein [Alsobacter soli]
MYRHILAATDGTPFARHAVEHAVGLARALGARLSIVTVTEPFHVFSLEVQQLEDTRTQYEAHAREWADRALNDAAALARAQGVSHDLVQVESDRPYQAIMDAAADRDCDLIVMASHGRRGLAAMILGSETLKVLTHSKVPVLVIRPGGAEPWQALT